jgi:CRISPR/Cas system-associated protein Csx1
MKTAMQELKDDILIEKQLGFITENASKRIIDYIDNLYLEKEKEQIQKAFSDGQETPINHPTLPHYSREEYYNDNYNQDN